jgi:hypothetical protein
MSTTSGEGGGASSGTQPSMITVPVNIPLPERLDLRANVTNGQTFVGNS